ncbi:hypothetical protein AB0H82_22350 [Streptomyces sp. NPDC050732]|uniref:hypothetical protein n=1 Tax=Streptomyces sp. NPDC050732 TaxID=3154632 RepID=UPI003438F1D9
MRLRRSATAALGALTLALTVPTSASAADGQFRYTYLTDEGYEAVGFLNNPPSGECINLYGVGSNDLRPGYSPKNRTDATAVVFLNADCKGDTFFSLRPHTGGGSERLKVRSVVFS